MGEEGLEPSRLAAHDPKSCSSASSDTRPGKKPNFLFFDYERPAIDRALFVEAILTRLLNAVKDANLESATPSTFSARAAGLDLPLPS